MKNIFRKSIVNFVVFFGALFFVSVNYNIALANFGVSPSVDFVEILPNEILERNIRIVRSGADLTTDMIVKVKKEKNYVDLMGQKQISLPAGERIVSFKYKVDSKNMKVGETYEDSISFSPQMGNVNDASGNVIEFAIAPKIDIKVIKERIIPIDYSKKKEANKNIELELIEPQKYIAKYKKNIFKIKIKNNSNDHITRIPYKFNVHCDNKKKNSNNTYYKILEPKQEVIVEENNIFKKSGKCNVKLLNDYTEQSHQVIINSKFISYIKNIWTTLF